MCGIYTFERLPLSMVFYISRALIQPADVSKMVGNARQTNALLGLSGGLLYTGNYFAQVLEGRTDVLLEKMNAIAEDPRHFRVTRLLGGSIRHRQYRGWTMGYVMSPGADVIIDTLLLNETNVDLAQGLVTLLREWISH